MAKVDVLIPAYNAADTIRQSIESVQAQTLINWRIVIVNDGSTDDTGQILAEIAAKDARIHVHSQPNGGIVDAMNAGLGLCNAEFVARFDADDICYPERFEFQIDYLTANSDVIGIGAGVRHIDVDGRPTGSFARIGTPDKADPWFVPAAEPYLVHPFFTVRRWAIDAVNGYRHVHYAEDSDLYWRLSRLGRLYNPEELLGDYRFHANSISSTSIVNGRIMAISSQLTGISEQRRRRGVPDLEFAKQSLAEYKRVKTLRAMIGIAEQQLDDTERAYFRIAVPAKLLELTAYRPYEIEDTDCDYIGDFARGGLQSLSPQNRGLMQRRITGAAARIAAAGRMADARRMVPPRMMTSFASRYALRAALPDPIRRHFRRSDTKSSPFK